MKRLLMVDYCGNCDAKGNSIGHSAKVLKEYSELLQEEYDISVAVPRCIQKEIQEIDYDEIYQLPYQIVEEGNMGIWKRIVDKFKIMINISRVFGEKNYDVLWFYRADFFLFLYLMINPWRVKPKIMCLVYWQKYKEGLLGKILDFVCRKGMKKIDGIIYTQKASRPDHQLTFYMPDYYYDEEKYAKYLKIKKENKVICLGTMNSYKKLEEIVDVFNKNGMKLEIVGKFCDLNRYKDLCNRATGNIVIENVILPTDEYYIKLASAKYAILPYDMKQYNMRTSGVLIEALFVQTIPIAPRLLLEENEICGIGYDNIEELNENFCLNDQKIDDFELKMQQQINKYPTRKKIKKDILQFVEKLIIA